MRDLTVLEMARISPKLLGAMSARSPEAGFSAIQVMMERDSTIVGMFERAVVWRTLRPSGGVPWYYETRVPEEKARHAPWIVTEKIDRMAEALDRDLRVGVVCRMMGGFERCGP